MFHRIEVYIRPIVKNGVRIPEVETIEKRKEEFSGIFSLGSMLQNDRRGRVIGAGIALILASGAALEFSKAVIPFVSPDTIPPNRWHPVLEQISAISETSLVVGILAAVAAIYMGKSAFHDRHRFRGTRRAFNRINFLPAHYPDDITSEVSDISEST